MFKHSLSLKTEDLKNYIISRDEFFRIQDKEGKTAEDNLKLLINSFGNDCKSYLYSKENSDLKYNLAVEIIENEENWRQYRQTDTYKNKLKEVGSLKCLALLEQLARLQQLEALKQVERLQELEQPKQLQLYNKSYKDFSHLENTIIYLDPPYENTKKYNNEDFNHQEFYDWVVEIGKKNIVLISSYEITDKRFECVYEFTTARSTMQSGISSNTSKMERLFMVKQD